MKIIRHGVRFYLIIWRLAISRTFLILTFFGNLIIVLFSYLFYFLEKDTNPLLGSFLDALWWGFSTATTVGYGDTVPITSFGKIVGILLMLIGTALFATYTALFAGTILEDDLFQFSPRRPDS
jgi:voltage-gated potassium channel